MEDYDPIRPNDYEMYMEQQNRMKEDEERRRLERIRRSSRRRSLSVSSSDSASRSRSPSPVRYNSRCRKFKNKFMQQHNAWTGNLLTYSHAIFRDVCASRKLSDFRNINNRIVKVRPIGNGSFRHRRRWWCQSRCIR